MKLELWVEGPTDAVKRDGRVDGALWPLLRKLLANGMPGGKDNKEQFLARIVPEQDVEVSLLKDRLRGMVRFERQGRPSKRRSGARAWKLKSALDKVRLNDEQTMVVAVWDSDGRDGPIDDRDEVNGHLRAQQLTGAVVGVCVPMIEAWLLDEATFKACFGAGPDTGMTSQPEQRGDPKRDLQDQLQKYPSEDDGPAVYAKLAQGVDVERLARRCPRCLVLNASAAANDGRTSAQRARSRLLNVAKLRNRRLPLRATAQPHAPRSPRDEAFNTRHLGLALSLGMWRSCCTLG